MATKMDSGPRARVPLTRERVLRAAMTLADKGGIESLSMRKLGLALGVEAMSLYNHVANKDEILDGIVDLVAGEVEVPATEGDWKAAVRQSAISTHEVLLRHPWACSLSVSRPRVGAAK
ncbi:MAG TPA: TetR family transcriptional regulator, partial [Acidimicrobiia bacterium]|nr:TetR family transcriptional regulator [Acidimicrobiia bacterium]